MKAAEAQSGWPAGYGRRVFEEVDSTNAEAMRIAGQIGGPEWIMARRQSAGRGRRGRTWRGGEGNFFATLILRPAEAPGQAALRSFVAALALRDALAEVTAGRAELALKWPNDALLDGGKVAGVLLESGGQGERLSHLAIGFGVNLAQAPAAEEIEPGALRAVSLRGETGVEVAPEAFLERLAWAYADWEAVFARRGFAPIREAWLACAARRGEQITARTGREAITGAFEGVDEAGNLVIRGVEGCRRIAAADVFF